MLVKDYIILEYNNIFQSKMKSIQKDARKIRTYLDKQKEKKHKEEEKTIKKQKKEFDKFIKNDINEFIKYLKKNIKEKDNFINAVEKYKHLFSDKIYQILQYLSTEINKLKSKKQKGTRLITKNYLIIPKILNNKFIQQIPEPKINKIISRILKISNLNINNKENNISLTLKSINNQLFNSLRDLGLELIRYDLFNEKGLYDDN